MKNLRIIVSNTIIGGCYIDKGHYEDYSTSPIVKDGGAGYTYTQCKQVYIPERRCGKSGSTHYHGTLSDGRPIYAWNCPDHGLCTESCSVGSSVGTITCGAVIQSAHYEYTHSNAKKYECPCTNGQLIGIVINYTVGDTAGSITLTTP